MEYRASKAFPKGWKEDPELLAWLEEQGKVADNLQYWYVETNVTRLDEVEIHVLGTKKPDGSTTKKE